MLLEIAMSDSSMVITCIGLLKVSETTPTVHVTMETSDDDDDAEP